MALHVLVIVTTLGVCSLAFALLALLAGAALVLRVASWFRQAPECGKHPGSTPKLAALLSCETPLENPRARQASA